MFKVNYLEKNLHNQWKMESVKAIKCYKVIYAVSQNFLCNRFKLARKRLFVPGIKNWLQECRYQSDEWQSIQYQQFPTVRQVQRLALFGHIINELEEGVSR